MPYSTIECCISKVPDTHHKDPSNSPERGNPFCPFLCLVNVLVKECDLEVGIGRGFSFPVKMPRDVLPLA